MMYKNILSVIMGAAIMCFVTYTTPTMAASTTGKAAADIVTVITIAETTAMSFGDIATTGAGTVVLDTANLALPVPMSVTQSQCLPVSPLTMVVIA